MNRIRIPNTKITTILVVLLVLLSFGVMINHVTHHDTSHENCVICSFVSSLAIVSLPSILFIFTFFAYIYRAVNRIHIITGISFHVSRAPPAHIISL